MISVEEKKVFFLTAGGVILWLLKPDVLVWGQEWKTLQTKASILFGLANVWIGKAVAKPGGFSLILKIFSLWKRVISERILFQGGLWKPYYIRLNLLVYIQ